MVKSIKRSTPEQQQIAQLLFSLTALPFVPPAPKPNSSYITLDAGEGRNKNAVSVSRHHVSFMVKDFAIREFADARGLVTREFSKVNSKRDDRRLQFLGLTKDNLREHQDFFRDMLNVAYKESKDRQEH
jgi:hypothetical protein